MGSTLECWWHLWVLSPSETTSNRRRGVGEEKKPPPSLPCPEPHCNIPTHMHTRVNTHTRATTHAPRGVRPLYRVLPGHHLIQFLGNPDQLLSGPHAGGSRLAGLRRPPQQSRGGSGQSWALPAWGGRQGWEGWEGAEKGGKKGGKKKGKGREGRASRKEVGLSRPVINSCQAGEIARGRAKYSWKRQAGPGLPELGEARAGVHQDTRLSQPGSARGVPEELPAAGLEPGVGTEKGQGRGDGSAQGARGWHKLCGRRGHALRSWGNTLRWQIAPQHPHRL